MKVTIGYTIHLEPWEMQEIRKGLDCTLNEPSKLANQLDSACIDAASDIMHAHGYQQGRTPQKSKTGL